MKALNKALNLAITRTVGQLARHGAEGCHPPMLFALEQHLDALLTMERKQLEQVPGKLVAFSTPQEKNGTLLAGFMDEAPLSVPPVKWTPEMVAAFNRMEPVQLHTDSIITGGKRLGKSEVDKLLRTPVEKWTSDQLAWFKANVVLSNAERDALDDRWKAANTPAETAPGEAASEPHDKPVQWYQSGVHGIGDPGLHWTPSADSEQPVPPAPVPDAIDMTDPRNWQAGDVLRSTRDCLCWKEGQESVVTYSDSERVHIRGHIAGQYAVWMHGLGAPASDFFTWLRHGEAQE